MKWLKDILTTTDNETYDLIHVVIFVGVLAYFIMTGWHLYDENVFSPKEFAEGLTMLLVGSGLGAGAKTLAEGKSGTK